MKLRLLVGLGNPGESFKFHRHNVGFLVLDDLARRFSLSFSKSKRADALLAKGSIQGQPVVLVKPETFMNGSGKAVKFVKELYNISLTDLIIVTDELYIPFGEIQFQEQGGTKGHNGLKSVRDCLKTNDYKRLRIGLGFSDREVQLLPKEEFVLTSFDQREKAELLSVINKATDALVTWLLFETKGIEEFLTERKD